MRRRTRELPPPVNAMPFRPSIIPKLEECLVFRPKPGETESTVRGTGKHDVIAQILDGRLALSDIEDRETYADVAWVRSELETRGIGIREVEWEIPFTVDGQEVWRCTTDAVGFDHQGTLYVCDWKSGDERDYSGQFAAYAQEVMRFYKVQRCVFLVLYFDLRKAYEFDVELSQAEERILTLYRAWMGRGNAAPQINQYCDYCALRANCPAWLAEGNKALEPVPEYQPYLWDVESIKSDPVRLGEFYGAYKRLVKLVEDEWELKAKVLEYLLNGIEVPGFTKARDASYQSVDTEKVLLTVVKEMGTAKAAEFIKVSVPKMLEAWKVFSPDKSLPVEVTTVTPGTFHAKVVTPKGRGAAALARKERKAVAA